MIVMTNNCLYYLVLLDTGMDISDVTDKNVLLGIKTNGSIRYGWMGLSEYNENLEVADEEYSIQEVFTTNCGSDIGKINTYSREEIKGMNLAFYLGRIEI